MDNQLGVSPTEPARQSFPSLSSPSPVAQPPSLDPFVYSANEAMLTSQLHLLQYAAPRARTETKLTGLVEINDALFCEHGLEVCKNCEFDAREDNDAMMGLDPMPRDPLELPAHYKNTKDGSIMCKAHANPSCKSCFAWKKQIGKLHKEGKKNAKKVKPSGSNF